MALERSTSSSAPASRPAATRGGGLASWSIRHPVSVAMLALAVGIAFPLLELAGFEAVPGGGGDLPLFALAALYSLVPVAFKLASIALMRGYPITAVRHDRLRRRIEARQASKTGSLA